MRVGAGIILSVLSSSVLAAVIPNDDSHGILLVRRTVGLENKDVSWSKDNADEVKFVPSSSGAGGGAGSGGNRGSSKMSQFRDYIQKLYMNLKTKLSPRQKKSIKEKDIKSVKTAAQKVTEVVQGEETEDFLFEVDNFLNNTLDAARTAYMLYDDPDIRRIFLLSIPKGSTQKSLTKAMVKLQNTERRYTKEHLGDVVRAFSNLTKHPRNVIRELGKILESILRKCQRYELLYNQSYMNLLSKVGHINNEVYIKDAQEYLFKIKSYRDGASGSFNYIKEMLDSGEVTFKGKNSSKFATFKSGFKNRLRVQEEIIH
ncbi:hypothetical protein BASA60_004544 [Batrachochytrium salamandrivorans]|nr:hypothetical protein BASA60_004544 [Batrachochytrium salamandrivorans]